MEKFTTHTPELLGIPLGVWPTIGGPENAGEGVVVGFIDSGINPEHPSFVNYSFVRIPNRASKYRGECITGRKFPSTACNGKIIGARYFASTTIAKGDFNGSRESRLCFSV